MKVRSLAVINLAPADDDLVVAVVPGPVGAVGAPVAAVPGPIGPVAKVVGPVAKAAVPMAKVAAPVPAPVPPVLPQHGGAGSWSHLLLPVAVSDLRQATQVDDGTCNPLRFVCTKLTVAL